MARKSSVSPLVPTVPIDLGGKTYNLKLDLKTMIEYKKATGENLLAVFGDLADENGDFNPEALGKLVWACIVYEDASLTIDDIGSMIHIGNFNAVSAAFTTLSEKSMPKGNGASGARPTKSESL